MDVYRLIKESEYTRLFSDPGVSTGKLLEEGRGKNFDQLLGEVLAKTYSSETERATAVQRALQDFILYQRKTNPASYDHIRSGQTLSKSESREESPITHDSASGSTYDTTTNLVTPKSKGRTTKRATAKIPSLRTVLARDQKTIRLNAVLTNRTRAKHRKNINKDKAPQTGGWLSWI